jgi:hypothetical protein
MTKCLTSFSARKTQITKAKTNTMQDCISVGMYKITFTLRSEATQIHIQYHSIVFT